MRSLFALLLAFTASDLNAQSAPRTGVIEGRVIHAITQQPIPSAQVLVPGTGRGAQADETGRFRITAVPVGIVSLQARAIGYSPIAIADVAVSITKPAEVTVKLTPAALNLAAVQIQASYFTPPPDAQVSTATLSREETRRAPGVQEDVIRAVALLPGVAVTQAGRNDLAVRGGAPFQNLFVVDGIEVPNINHFGSQGSTGGPLSLINIQFVDETQFSAGGFGARYGDRTNSVTSLTLREGSRSFGGELNLSATGYGAFVEGPMGKRGSYLFGVRRSYLDLVFKAAGFGFIPAYTDLTFKATQRLNSKTTLSMLAVGAIDDITFNNETADNRYENSRVVGNEQRQYFSGITLKRVLSRGVLDVTLGRTWSRYQTAQFDSLSPPNPIFRANTTEGEQSLRADVQLEPRAGLEVGAGAMVKFASALEYDILLPGFARFDAAGAPRPLTVDTSFTAARTAAYGQVSWKPMSRVRLTLGARGDHYAFLDDGFRFSPRLGARVGVNDQTTLTFAAGRYWQAPQFIWLIGDPTNRDALRPFRADHLVAGIEREVRSDVKVQAEAYLQRFSGMPARLWRPQAVLAPAGFDDITTDIPFGLEPLRSIGTGTSYGVELLARKVLSSVPVYGLATISLNRTEFTSFDGIARPGAFETRWIANLLGGWRPNPTWEFSGKFRAAAGLPYTPFITSGPRAGQQDFSRYNEGGRLPSFVSLDLRADRRWSFARRSLIAYIDLQNVNGAKGAGRYTWDQREQRVKKDESIGLLPSIGINLQF
ncbi:MAG: TonB-dependent receptor [Gemmatimonadetes bacterium]|nr:TonB-dependent receptor [Gemmatimonadota bacterium]